MRGRSPKPSLPLVGQDGRGLGRADGERETEGAAVAGGAFDPEAAAVELDELAGEGEAESGAFGSLAVRRLLELLEDHLELLRRDARAGVRDGDLDLAVVEPGGDVDAALGGSELDRVGHEVKDDLADATPVGEDRDLLRLRRQ